MGRSLGFCQLHGLNLICPRWMVLAILCLRAGRAPRPDIPQPAAGQRGSRASGEPHVCFQDAWPVVQHVLPNLAEDRSQWARPDRQVHGPSMDR